MASETQRGHSRNLPTVTVRPYTDETTDSGERRAESGGAIAGSQFGLRSTLLEEPRSAHLDVVRA